MFNCPSGLELIHENKQLCQEATILTTVNVAAKIRQEAHIKTTNSAEEHIQPAETSITCNKNNQCYRPEVRSSLSSGLN